MASAGARRGIRRAPEASPPSPRSCMLAALPSSQSVWSAVHSAAFRPAVTNRVPPRHFVLVRDALSRLIGLKTYEILGDPHRVLLGTVRKRSHQKGLD